MGTVTLRPATEGDLDDLVRLTTDFYREDGFSTQPGALPERFTAFLAEPQAHVALAMIHEAAVGFALTTMRLILESGLVAELQDLYVEPEHRRKGIGSTLVRDAERWARGRTAAVLDVVIAPNGRDVSHLHRYYEGRGFVDDGRHLIHRELGAPDHHGSP